MLKTYSDWKFWLSAALFVLMVMILITDFSDSEGLGGWGVPLEGKSISNTQQYGVKAALMAMLTAGTLLVAMLPGGNSRYDRWVGFISRALSAAMAMATGWYWLLNAAGGDPRPYIAALVPMALVSALAIANYMAFSYVREVDRQYEDGQHSRTTIHWGAILVSLGLVVLILGGFFLLAWLPPRIF